MFPSANSETRLVNASTIGELFLSSSSLRRLLRFAFGIPSPLSLRTSFNSPSSPDSSSIISSSSPSIVADCSINELRCDSLSAKNSDSIISFGISAPSKDLTLVVSSSITASPFSSFTILPFSSFFFFCPYSYSSSLATSYPATLIV